MQLPEEATEEETDEYVEFWQSRGDKVIKIMNWDAHLIAWDPDFHFRTYKNSIITLSLDVVDKLIELDERIQNVTPTSNEGE